MDNGESSYRRFISEGDESGLDEIIIEYRNGLMFFLCGIVSDEVAAEELAEDTFVVLGTKKPRYNGTASFKTWLYTIGKNLACNYLKKRSRSLCDSIDDHPSVADDDAQIEKYILRDERNLILYRTMKELKSEYRQVLHLIYFDGFTNRQVAAVMKKSVHSIETLAYRARLQLKKLLQEKGVTYENL